MKRISPQESTWSGLPAWMLESERLRALIVPMLGGKLVSLFDRKTNHEWLAPPGKRVQTPIPYGASFIEYSLSGWDEMFPTILAGSYPAPGPFYGRSLPDHGEVWTQPWKTQTADQGELALSVEGIMLPYRLSRSLTLADPETLAMRYRLSNLSDEQLIYLWAAHPLFAGDESLRIVLPAKIHEVVNVQASETWGPAGVSYGWPQTRDREGQFWSLDRVRGSDRRDARKFYLTPETRASWAGLVHEASSSELRLTWDPEQLPYLGLWVDEGCYSFRTTVALEPASGFYDSLELAWQKGRASLLSPHASREWYLTVSLGPF